MIYVASPYTHDNPVVEIKRFLLTEQFCALQMRNCKPVFSPIVYCHELAKKYKLPTDADYWWGFNETFLRRSDELCVLMLKDWQKSKGIELETEWWKQTYPKHFCVHKTQGQFEWLVYTQTG